MTATALPRADPRPAPQSQDLAVLHDALRDPALVGWDAEIRAAIQRLTEKMEAA